MKYFVYRENRQQGTPDFPVAYYQIEPSHPRYQMTYHWHPEYELIRILKGTFHLTIGSQTTDYHAGDILFIQEGILHGGIPEDCIYECLVFDLKFLLKGSPLCIKQLQKIQRNEILIHQYIPNHLTPIKETLNQLFSIMAGKTNGYQLITQGLLFQLMGLLIEHQLYDTSPTQSASSHQHMMQFKNVLSYIEDHYTEDITLTKLAQIAGMNPKYFCRFFREMSYRTPIDYVNYYRIEQACEQLATSQLSILDVALNCGFNDLSYFIKTFKKFKNITPKQYVKNEFKNL